MPDEHSDAELSRREFIERTAYAAGLAGAASVLPVETIVSQAAEAATKRNPLPSPRNVEIDHFVILMMENRSYDHYFGWLTEVSDGKQHQTYRNIVGQPVATRHASWMGRAEWQGCDHPDPGHGWDAGRAQLNGGFLAQGSGNDEFALSYYNKGELPAIHAAAENYTLYDRYFCSILCSTWPNRYYKWAAQSGGIINNNPPVASVGNQWDTIFDVALRKPGLTARYYQSDLPFSAVWGPRAVPWTHNVQEYYQDAAAGTLPNISIIDPPFRDGGGFEGMSADEHPLGDVRLGQAFMADVVNAFVALPELPPRSAVRHLRRVGRVLRPRPAAPGGRRAHEPRPEQGLRPDGLPHPGRDRVALLAAQEEEGLSGRPGGVRTRVDPQADQ